MLEKIQEISNKLDKKRVYTAVGALVVALATGHVMQRTVSQPQVAVDMGGQEAPVMVQGADMTAQIAPQPDATSIADPTPQPELVAVEAPSEPMTEMVAEAPIEEQIQEPAPVETAADDLAPETTQDMVTKAQSDPAPAPFTPEAETAPIEVAALDQTMAQDMPEMVDTPIQVADVTRSFSTEDLSPQADDQLFDIEPAAPVIIEQPETADACAADLSLSTMNGAMIYVKLDAPCAQNGVVDFNHAGLRFTEKLDEAGSVSIVLPALTTQAKVSAEISGTDTRVSKTVTVPDMADFDRVALVWQGGTGLQLHALENGAFYGEPGHVWAETPGTPDRATKGEGGYLSVLGSTAGGFAADVYTYPAAMTTEPAISIEAQVLETTCEAAIVGEYLRSSPTEAPTATEVGMVVPGCDAVGEYLVLKNLPQEMKIARN